MLHVCEKLHQHGADGASQVYSLALIILNFMGAYETETKQAKEFVYKTLRVIQQYEDCSKNFGLEKFEVTLKINCLIGLIITPQQYFNGLRPVSTLLISECDEADWGISVFGIDYGINSSRTDVFRNDVHRIAKHIRNSIAHNNRFILKLYGGDEITHVHFTDYKYSRSVEEDKTFEYEFRVDDLNKFANKYAKLLM